MHAISKKKWHDCPYLSVDMVCYWRGGIILVERKHPPLGLALPGGMVDYGEDPRAAAIRELKEETNIDGKIIGFSDVYGEPGRDPRGHIVTLAYVLIGDDDSIMKGQDSEVKNVIAMEPDDAMAQELIADHGQILEESMSIIYDWKAYN